jgi:hypothetical protein
VNRAEHLRWAKDRAIEYADRGETAEAIASLGSDLNKHPDTKGHVGMQLMMMMAISRQFERPGELRKFIEEGFR